MHVLTDNLFLLAFADLLCSRFLWC